MIGDCEPFVSRSPAYIMKKRRSFFMALPVDKDIYIESLSEERSCGMNQSHIHDYYEIFYLLEGKRRYFINHTLYDVLPHDIILVNKADVHLSQPATPSPEQKLPGNKYARFLITFSDDFLDSLGSAFDRNFIMKAFNEKKLHIPDNMQNSFSMLLNKMQNKINNEDEYSKYICKLTLIEILVTLNNLSEKNVHPLLDSLTVYEDRIQEVCHYICNYYNEPITLEQMAKIAYMSPTYFSKKFKRVTGFGLKEYLNNIRIKMATNMLMETQYSITEIAAYCGYNDSNYFGDVFKKIVGVSPIKYRKEHYMD